MNKIMMKISIISVLMMLALSAVFGKDMTIARDNTALRDGPANYYDPIVYLSKGTVVNFLNEAEEDAGWLFVEYGGRQGYISSIALKEVKKQKTSDPFASLDFGASGGKNSSKKSKNEMAPAAYTAAIKGFAVNYSAKIGANNLDINDIVNLTRFDKKDVRKVRKETKLAYFPKKGELIGDPKDSISANLEAVGLAASLSVLRNGVVFDRELTKKANVIANMINRQTIDYDKMYYVFIIPDKEPVAYSGPGGYIFLSDTMMKYLTDYRELVAVIAHEVGHIALRHGVKDMALDNARKNMEDAFGEIDEMLSEEEKMLSDDLQDVIDEFVDKIKLVHDDKEEYEADEIAIELLRRYKIDKKYMKSTLDKIQSAMGATYPEYKEQFRRRRLRIK
ncbi:MAG: M48 family metalloprotease [Spirochaetales bacterium]|nr:M48 family metalloprotease [Spirochaetales bacterium]